ncbi:MAG TPA: hypothetical protein VIK01_29615 [Polyangiaceae bacterium]
MAARFTSSIYNVTTAGGDKLAIDVTNSISAGLPPNKGLIDDVVRWMKELGCTRVLDFGAGVLRHSIPLLKAGFEVTAVEYQRAYDRPKGAEYRAIAERYPGFTRLMWPGDFVKSKVKYDVAILAYVLQVVPVKTDREVILEQVAKRFDQNGPKRLYYASRFGDAVGLEDSTRYNDGWVKGRGANDRTFYTEWSAADTNAFFKREGYHRAGTYKGPSQPYIYEFNPGVI